MTSQRKKLFREEVGCLWLLSFTDKGQILAQAHSTSRIIGSIDEEGGEVKRVKVRCRPCYFCFARLEFHKLSDKTTQTLFLYWISVYGSHISKYMTHYSQLISLSLLHSELLFLIPHQ